MIHQIKIRCVLNTGYSEAELALTPERSSFELQLLQDLLGYKVQGGFTSVGEYIANFAVFNELSSVIRLIGETEFLPSSIFSTEEQTYLSEVSLTSSVIFPSLSR
eukprot:m.87312 g.87312  ORF g.87312 m.87312 type:complete len:105 (-) comp12238_c0_seq1:126-440(-)